MSASVNKVFLIGHLGKDPESRYLPNGTRTVSMSLATTEKWKDKSTGDTKEKTEWHRVICYGRLAEIAAEYLKKGRLVHVEGKLTTHKWTDKAGADHWQTEIAAKEMKMLGKAQETSPSYDSSFEDPDSDIPF